MYTLLGLFVHLYLCMHLYNFGGCKKSLKISVSKNILNGKVQTLVRRFYNETVSIHVYTNYNLHH
jgi:hypothetical protein